jgi:hypothetical protein
MRSLRRIFAATRTTKKVAHQLPFTGGNLF